MMKDLVVIGGGHAGCEAALAGARMGLDTLLLTLNMDGIALMACNPVIGGSAKGHLVRELDAMGGEMGRAIDDTFLQSRMLNMSKGPFWPGSSCPARTGGQAAVPEPDAYRADDAGQPDRPAGRSRRD